MFDFKEVTEGTFGASDFMAICKQHFAIILKNVTILKPTDKNAMRRLILLVDEIYNNNVN